MVRSKRRIVNIWNSSQLSSSARKCIIIIAQLLLVGTLHAAEVKVSAAASLTDALTELAKLYEQSHPDIQIKTSFAGSSTLAKQIENGAQADLFISADKDWADYLEKRNLLNSQSRKNLLTNQLVLIAPSASQLNVQMAKEFDLAKSFSGKLCTGDPAYVPVGKYAKQALVNYGWWKAIETRVVGADDVRTALAFVERGECPLGIVYQTDAQMSKKVKAIARFSAESHQPIVYPGALTKKAGDDARTFWQFLQSAPATEIFEKYGFASAN